MNLGISVDGSHARSVLLDEGGVVLARAEARHDEPNDAIVDPSREDVVQRIVEMTDGRGVDSAIEALGADITFQNAIKVAKAGGTISNIGYHGQGEYVHIPRIEWGVGMAEKTIKTGLCPGGRLRLERRRALPRRQLKSLAWRLLLGLRRIPPWPRTGVTCGRRRRSVS